MATTDESVLVEVERILKRNRKTSVSIYDFVGIFSKKEIAKMRITIEESCEIIDADEWR